MHALQPRSLARAQSIGASNGSAARLFKLRHRPLRWPGLDAASPEPGPCRDHSAWAIPGYGSPCASPTIRRRHRPCRSDRRRSPRPGWGSLATRRPMTCCQRSQENLRTRDPLGIERGAIRAETSRRISVKSCICMLFWLGCGGSIWAIPHTNRVADARVVAAARSCGHLRLWTAGYLVQLFMDADDDA
jgi:hypothetical protein